MNLDDAVAQEPLRIETQEAGVPDQSLINLYRRDCLAHNLRIQIKWPDAA